MTWIFSDERERNKDCAGVAALIYSDLTWMEKRRLKKRWKIRRNVYLEKQRRKQKCRKLPDLNREQKSCSENENLLSSENKFCGDIDILDM